ncbi:hypothetical protein [Pseudofrankia sp. BMG5.36]|uniref:hypothetical protein n=1 Tax=Pseudofrankia sp. BMG5.36 TaxID=1834512 RepID=UPI0008DAFC1A|nr:hypothetical protein [Pseudofrankia sp. BMG5.36]OHV49325.1 hypothetical protein BCD48_12770 [Pseudofrankia sp. BMG5.36]
MVHHRHLDPRELDPDALAVARLLNRSLDVTATVVSQGFINIRLYRERGASDEQVDRVRRLIDSAGFDMTDTRVRGGGDVSYQVRRR